MRKIEYVCDACLKSVGTDEVPTSWNECRRLRELKVDYGTLLVCEECNKILTAEISKVIKSLYPAQLAK
jgi:hypothetical protein